MNLPSGATARDLLTAAAKQAEEIHCHLDFSSAFVNQNGRRLAPGALVSGGKVDLLSVKVKAPLGEEETVPITVVIHQTTTTQETMQVKKWQSVKEITKELNERYGTNGQITGAYGKIVDGSLSDATIKQLQTGEQRYIYTANK